MTLISLHIIQNHAPSNLNRDDNGDPKDTLFGNARRARISSQAIKRSIRWNEDFRSAFDPDVLGIRTQLLPKLISEELQKLGASADEEKAIVGHAMRFGKSDATNTNESENAKKKGKTTGDTEPQAPKTAQLMFLSNSEVRKLAQWLLDQARKQSLTVFATLETSKLVKDIEKNTGLYEPHAVDIAMFGRMTTSSPFKDTEAAVQVAHAISTHKIDAEFDFFTGVDDISQESGAGMLGDVAFNSATYYKYINIHWEGLVANLGNSTELAKIAVVALLNAALTAIPSGKQNTFAAHNLPDFALIEVLDKNIPVSYANAFITPVQATVKKSLVQRSVEELLKYAQKIGTKYELASKQAMFSLVDGLDTQIQDCNTVSALGDWLRERLPATEA